MPPTTPAASIRERLEAGLVQEAIALGERAAAGSLGRERGHVLVELSHALTGAGRAVDGYRTAIEAATLFRHAEDTLGELAAVHASAVSLQFVDDHPGVLAALEPAEATARALGVSVILAEIEISLGISCSILAHHDQAGAHLACAIATLEAHGETRRLLRARRAQINARVRRASRLDRDDPARAPAHEAELPHWAALAHDAAQVGMHRIEVMALGNYAICARESGREADAAGQLEALIERYRRYAMKPNEVIAWNHLGAARLALGRNEEARDAFLEALALLAGEGTSVREARVAWHQLSVAHERLGDIRAALDALRKSTEFIDRIDDKEARDRIARTEVRLELSRLTSEWSRLAQEDALTGLPNRRALDTWLAAALTRAGQGEALTLLVIDIDHFKAINDTWGHPVGDSVLREIALLLRSGTRPSDMPARFGGEEFVVALAAMDRAGGEDIASRLRAAIATHDWPALAPALRVTVSVGVASAAEARDARTLLALADRRLYAAKRRGRNVVVAAD